MANGVMKKFIIIGNQNAIGTKEIFPYIKDDKIWLGVSMNGANRWFMVPDKYEFWGNAANSKIENGKKMLFVNGVVWFTNISNEKRNAKLDLFRKYSNEYPHYDNFNAIEVSRVENIPADYDGAMGVPISFLHKYNPAQFEIVDLINRYMMFDTFGVNEDVRKRHSHCCNVNNHAEFARLLIRKRNA